MSVEATAARLNRLVDTIRITPNPGNGHVTMSARHAELIVDEIQELRRYVAYMVLDPHKSTSTRQVSPWETNLARADRITEELADAAMYARLGHSARRTRRPAPTESPEP